MLVTAFGVPTEFSAFCIRVLRALMDAAYADNHFVQVEALESLRQSLEGKKVTSILLYSEFPEKNIIVVSSKVSQKSIVFYEPPEISAGYSKNIRKMGFVDCLRYTCKSMALISLPLANPRTLVLPYAEEASLDAILSYLARYLEIADTIPLRERIAANLGLGEIADFALPLARLVPMLISSDLCHDRSQSFMSPDELAILQGLALRREDISAEGIRSEIVWPGNLFFVQNKRREVSTADGQWTEMLGPARYLYFGPYLCIPPGNWSIRAEFRVRNNQSSNRAEFDVVQDGSILAFGTFDIPASGIFEVTADLVNEQPEKPLEFRIHMREGAIDGQIVLDRVCWQHGGR
jgi:hypothetical protein